MNASRWRPALNRWNLVAIIVALLGGIATASGQTADHSSTLTPQVVLSCIQDMARPNYIAWGCDAQGHESAQSVVLFSRTALSGTTVTTTVWRGQGLTGSRFAQLVLHNEERTASCRAYFHTAHVLQQQTVNWNQTPNDAADLIDDGSAAQGLCYTPDPWFADYIIIWAESVQSVQSSIAIPFPQRQMFSGMIGNNVFSGSFNATNWIPGPFTQQIRSLAAAVLPVLDKDGQRVMGTTAVHSITQSGDHAGRQAFEDLLTFLESALPPG